MPNTLWKECYFLINFLKSHLHIYYIWQFYKLGSSNTKVFYDVKSSDTKLAMLSNIMQYLKKMASFINVFTKYLTKPWGKRCHILTQSFKIHFNMYVLLCHHVFLYLKFYVLFCFCHHSFFNVSLLYLFMNVFTRYLSKTWWKRCHILTQNSKIEFNMYVSLHHHVFLYLNFIYLSIRSLLLAEGTTNAP